jgi:hypothetical protein
MPGGGRKGYVCFWHFSELPLRAINVRLLGNNGRHMLAASLTGFDPKRTLTLPAAVHEDRAQR